MSHSARTPVDRREEYLRASPPPGPAPAPGMVWIPGGDFLMGSADFYPEERPIRETLIAGFWMDRAPVANAAFSRFVQETGHVCDAETPTDPALHPGLDEKRRAPGGLVFRKPPGPTPLNDPARWWRFAAGANWRKPGGKRTGLKGRMNHPVVQVSYRDASAYAEWAGKSLPEEAEWEFAARGGLEGARYAWGDHERGPGGAYLANTWQGAFPWRDDGLDGHIGSSPVGSFPPNGFGLFDICGNVWEWTATPAPHAPAASGEPGCCPAKEGGARLHVLKGGSHLCSKDYCFRYRPAARSFQEADSSTNHIGFRCIIRPHPG